MTQIIPIKDLKNTSAISEMCHATDEPIHVTKNGYGDLVIMSTETYDRELGMLKAYRSLERSEQQIKAGEGSDARKQMKQLREKYGL